MSAVKRMGRFGLAPTMLAAMLLALAISAATVRADPDPPTCDGVPCDQQWECGSKCVCNPHALVCLDNTVQE